jgi:hypothetical protein
MSDVDVKNIEPRGSLRRCSNDRKQKKNATPPKHTRKKEIDKPLKCVSKILLMKRLECVKIIS